MTAVLSDRGHGSDAEERPGMTVYCDERVQAGMCAHIPATTHAGPHLEAHRTDSGGLAAVVHLLIKQHGSTFFSRWVLQCRFGPREWRVQGGTG